jgi:hypothetical protein
MAMQQEGVKQAHSLGGPAELCQDSPTAKLSLHLVMSGLATTRELALHLTARQVSTRSVRAGLCLRHLNLLSKNLKLCQEFLFLEVWQSFSPYTS